MAEKTRHLVVVTGFALAFVVVAFGSLSVASVPWRASYPVHRTETMRGNSLRIFVDSGDLGLVPSQDKALHLRGTVHYSLHRPRLSWASSSTGTVFRSTCPASAPYCSVDLTLAIPGSVRINATVESGNLYATNLAGDAVLRVDSGNVVATSLSGKLRMSASSGNVTGTVLTGRSASASVGSGDVTLSFLAPPGSVHASVNSGNITLALPAQIPYRVDASSNMGSTAVAVPTDPSSAHVVQASVDIGNVVVLAG